MRRTPSAGRFSRRRRRRSAALAHRDLAASLVYLPDLLGNVVAVIFVTASSTLFNTTGIEVAVHREANLERELNVTGVANILTGLLGGYAGCSSTSRSLLNFTSGGPVGCPA